MESDSIGAEFAPFIDEILQEDMLEEEFILEPVQNSPTQNLIENCHINPQRNPQGRRLIAINNNQPQYVTLYEQQTQPTHHDPYKYEHESAGRSFQRISPAIINSPQHYQPAVEELNIMPSPGSDQSVSSQASSSPQAKQVTEWFENIEPTLLENIIPVKQETSADKLPRPVVFLQVPTVATELTNPSQGGGQSRSINSPTNSTANPQKRVKKVQRSNQHNVIEKRYRHSINDRIDDLRGILNCGRDAKVSKSSVLRHAIEEIAHLRKRNKQLEDEIDKLKEGREPEPEPMLRFGQVRSDVSRMVFCFFGILFLFVPLTNYFDIPQFFASTTSSMPSHVGHVIPEDINKMAEIANEMIQKWVTIFMFVFINGAIFVYFMYRGLVHMEPITPQDSSEYKQFQTSYSLALKTFQSNNLDRAQHRINYCLNTLGRFRARSSLQGIGSILWCLILYMSNKLGIKWFVCCLASKIGSDEHRESSSMAAKAFSLSAKISFAKYDKDGVSRFALLSYVAQSMLLLQQAGDKIGPTETCQIYLQALVIIRTILPQSIAKIFDVRLLRRIKQLSKKDIEGQLFWVTDATGLEFLENQSLLNMESTFSSKTLTMCALDRVSSAFRSYMFGLTMNNLFNRCQVDIETIVHQLDLLQACSKGFDPLLYWFTSVIQWALSNVDDEYIQKFPLSEKRKTELMAAIENTPVELAQISSDAGAARLGVASYCLYRASVSVTKMSVESLLGTLELINVRLERACQEFGNACKSDRITGFQLTASIADLTLSVATMAVNSLHYDRLHITLIAEKMQDTSGIIRHVNRFLQPRVTRLGRWETSIATLTCSNPVTIFERARLYGSQKINTESSDSDTDIMPFKQCPQTMLDSDVIMRESLPVAFGGCC